MMNDVNLPDGWALATLENVATWGSGGTPSRSKPSYYEGDIPWVKTGDLGPRVLYKASEFISEYAVQNSSAKFFPKGSVAIAMYGATIGRTSILGIDATTNQACGVGNPIEGITFSEFLYYFLNNEKDNFIAKGKGGAQPNISQALIKEHPIPLPPLAEQKVIADKLDTLLAQVETTKARLERIPEILKSFRQSVLAAAVSGKLTEEWRTKYTYKISIQNILDFKHSLIERGIVKSSKQDIPLPFDEELSVIPDSWAWSRLITVCSLITDGKHGNCKDELNSGFYFLSAKDVSNKKLVYENARQINQIEFKEVHQRTNLEPGDICIVNTGATVGKYAIAGDNEHTRNTTFQKSVAVVKVLKEYANNKFVAYYFEDATLRLLKASSGSAVNNLLLGTMKQLPIPLPPIEEQTEIVRRVEELLAFADKVEAQVNAAQARVNNLTQSILAKAFRGELTADWRAANPELISGDNSAAALLEKIKAERAALVGKKTRKKA
ncbi:Type I restriction enzyme EcoKI specificity protein [Shewanella baltica]|uniref:restriction endonuclease subunit S n=1 Tax=Shewanella baltica TaxID=62322 RepID=UPI000F6F9C28|nr:restriction endonuclease subunit S [Shewanella baltica]VEF25181.1 Type I restriction enzyme EcoKI specificity protein [Shewanella baltica]